MAASQSTPPWLVVAKDVISFSLGVFGLLFQLLTGEVNPWLFSAFATLVGLPGIGAAIWLARASPPPEARPGTASPSSPSP